MIQNHEPTIDSYDLLDEVKYRSKLAMTITLTVGILGLSMIFWSVTQSNQGLRQIQENYHRVQALQGEVLRIDEVLTMSCWVASTTADEYWRQRYHAFVPILDRTLSELIRRSPPSTLPFIRETDTANRILVDYETEALRAASHSNKEYALLLLTSPEYALQKQRYSEGMRLLEEALGLHFQELLELEYQQINNREILTLIVIIGLAIFWIIIYRIAARWQWSMNQYLIASHKLKMSLTERAESHQQLAEERKMEVQGLRHALLQAERQERARLGRLVHDDLQQLIVALRLKSSIYRDTASSESERNSYQELVQMSDEALVSARDLVMRLRPPGERQGSLLDMLSMITAQFNQRYGLTVKVKSTGFIEPKHVEVRLLVFRAIRELLFNIVKYAQVEEAEVKLWNEADFDHFMVSDQGVGFDVEQLPVNSKYIQTGLGLLGMKEQFTLIGGLIDIHSVLGQGASIKVSVPNTTAYETRELPLKDEYIEVHSQSQSKSTLFKRKHLVGSTDIVSQYKILIVDDNLALRQMLTQIFQDLPEFIAVKEASSGPEAVEISSQSPVDLILIDYSLPGFDGAEATRQICAKHPSQKVIGFTSFDLPEVIRSFEEAGVSQVILKGSDPQDLINTCLSVISNTSDSVAHCAESSS